VVAALITRTRPAPLDTAGVLTADGQTALTDSVLDSFEGADEDVGSMPVEDLPTADVGDAVQAAEPSGVRIRLRHLAGGADLQSGPHPRRRAVRVTVGLVGHARRSVADGRRGTDVDQSSRRREALSDPRFEMAIRSEGDTTSLIVVGRGDLLRPGRAGFPNAADTHSGAPRTPLGSNARAPKRTRTGGNAHPSAVVTAALRAIPSLTNTVERNRLLAWTAGSDGRAGTVWIDR
jgi:hypothetical protein